MAEKKDNAMVADEIDMKDLMVQLWRKRRFILMVTAISLLAGIFIALLSPVQYTASSVILPQTGRQGAAGNLGSLASMVGVNIGTAVMPEGNISTGIYPQIIKSLPFVREVMETPIVVEKSGGDEITLYAYYTEKEYREVNVLSVVRKYTIGLPGTVVSAFSRTDKREEVTADGAAAPDSAAIVKISRQEQAVYNEIKQSIEYDYNSKEGVIRLGYTFPEALAAAQVSGQLHRLLEKYVVNYKMEKVQENLAFVEQSYSEARRNFLQKQASLASFQDANRGLVTATSRAAESRLRSEYEIAFTIYNELARQREQVQLSLNEEKPILTVVNPVIVPLERSAPRRSMIVAVCLLLGVIAATGWVLIKPYVDDLKAAVRKTADDERCQNH